MRELENRQKIRRRLYSIPALAVLLLITGALAKGAYSLILTERESSREANILAQKVEALREREKVLLAETKRLTTEAGIEEEIKSKFNVARAGEHVALIVDKPEPAASTSPEKLPWFKRLWNVIIN